ncbi:hypothetical protein [Leptolyngbya sp. NIES-2104]|uniref:hypothetical protein n=1 Tax=Leptolyngbya sp. NIES-2104 TaxID=1552121 RepID=UPI00073E998D|nr:hypothetical protein [Leptolyngbya sp. NIES-2104]
MFLVQGSIRSNFGTFDTKHFINPVGEHAVGLDRYFVEMAEPATSMNLSTEAITYMMDDPNHAIRLGAANGVRFLSLEETAKELPHYPGFGVR